MRRLSSPKAGLTLLSGHDDVDGSIVRYPDTLCWGDMILVWPATPYWVDTQRVVVIAPIETRERDVMDERTGGRHGGARHSADTTLPAGRSRQRTVVSSPAAHMSGVPPDLVDAVPGLAALLQALPPERTEVGFDELRLLCLSAITAAREEGAHVTVAAAARPLGEAASVLAACVISCSLQQGGQWRMSRDRRERLHPVAELVHVLVHDAPE